MINRIIKALYPQVCVLCEKIIEDDSGICNNCRTMIKVIREPKCQKCGKVLLNDEKLYCEDCSTANHFFDKNIAVFEYSGALRESLYKFKYNNYRVNGNYYAKAAVAVYGNFLHNMNFDAILPVPLYNKKKRKRGYNQAQVFAEYLSKYTGIKMDTKCLVRIKDTIPQKELSNQLRKDNLKDAFAINEKMTSYYKKVLLVDDIYTTGSTLDACSYLLKATGIKAVYGLCISAGRG